MARRNTAPIFGHTDLRKAIEEIQQTWNEQGYNLNLKQASLLGAKKIRRGKLEWDEAKEILLKEGWNTDNEA